MASSCRIFSRGCSVDPEEINPCHSYRIRCKSKPVTWIYIALGGALGSISRHGIGLFLARLENFPFGTMAANILGSLVIGVAAGL